MNLEGNIVGFEEEPQSEVVKNEKKNKKKLTNGFAVMNLSFPVLKGIQKRGYKTPTPIQRKCIPLVLGGRDVVAMARTGSGKTACFLVPMLEKLKDRAVRSGARALILSPTRELALQTNRFIKELGRFTGLKACVVLGGDSMDHQFSAIHGNPDIIVATPGRFLHVCIEMDLRLDAMEYVVFDEADRLFEMGFGEQLQEIFNRLPDTRQTLLFSATLPKLLVDFAKAGLHDPILLRLDVESKLPEHLQLSFLSVRSEEKSASLLCLLNKLPSNTKTVVFTATKHHVEYLHMLLDKAEIPNTLIYSDLDPSARKINAAKFSNGNVPVMIVTDVAARGIDIPILDCVVNYHFPAKPKLFVHRVGRCARAGKSGIAYSLVAPDEFAYYLDLHMFLGRPINLLNLGEQKGQEELEGGMGLIPQSAVEEQLSDIVIWQNNYADLMSMKKVCDNAYKKYLKSRPGASVESVRRVKEFDFYNLTIHPLFKSKDLTIENNLQFLHQIKKFKPNGTIFELNISSKAESYAVMKATRKAHQSSLKRNQEDQDNNDKEYSKVKTPQADKNDIMNTFDKVVTGKKRKGEYVRENEKNKKSKFYVPHFAPDHHTEAGLSVNSFVNEAHKVGFDITNDSVEGIHRQKKIQKWEMSRRERASEEKKRSKKIKTESGVWIPATYKSNRYSQWKEKSKVEDNEESEDEEETADKKNNYSKLKRIPNTHWGRHNIKIAEKAKAKSDIQRPEKILKNRIKHEKLKNKSLPKKGKRENQRGKKKMFKR